MRTTTNEVNQAVSTLLAAIKGTSATICIDEDTFDGNTRIEWNNIAVEVPTQDVDKAIKAIKALDALGAREVSA